jgi:Mn-containing catalase
VKETLRFLMTREIAHFQMFEAALQTIQPNFPPGVLQGDPKHSNTYFNMSNGADVRGPWNEGVSPGLGEVWRYVADPIDHVVATNGLVDQEIDGTRRTEETVQELNETLSKQRSKEVTSATPTGENQWSSYKETPEMETRTPANEASRKRTRNTPGTGKAKSGSSSTESV